MARPKNRRKHTMAQNTNTKPAQNSADQGLAVAAMMARIAELEAALQAKATKGAGKISFKVSAEKKALSVYGLGKWPVTLFRGGWAALLSDIVALCEFAIAHEATLAQKDGMSAEEMANAKASQTAVFKAIIAKLK
jgi:hypothetical protein